MSEKRVYEAVAEDIGREELFTNFLQFETNDADIPYIYLQYLSNYDVGGRWPYGNTPLKGKRFRITIEEIE